jgi:hypothetical protein
MIAALVLAFAFAASVALFATAKSVRARALALLPQPILLVFMVYAAAGSLALPRDATALAVIAAAATAVYATEVTLLFALRAPSAAEHAGRQPQRHSTGAISIPPHPPRALGCSFSHRFGSAGASWRSTLWARWRGSAAPSPGAKALF